MNLRKVFVPAIATAALLLGGCAQKTTYAEFHEKAAAAEKHSFTKASVKRSSEGLNAEAELKFGADVLDVATLKVWVYDSGDKTTGNYVATLINATTAGGFTENEGYTYYFVGNGYQVKDEEGTTTWTFESHGLLTSYADGSESITVSYK